MKKPNSALRKNDISLRSIFSGQRSHPRRWCPSLLVGNIRLLANRWVKLRTEITGVKHPYMSIFLHVHITYYFRGLLNLTNAMALLVFSAENSHDRSISIDCWRRSHGRPSVLAGIWLWSNIPMFQCNTGKPLRCIEIFQRHVLNHRHIHWLRYIKCRILRTCSCKLSDSPAWSIVRFEILQFLHALESLQRIMPTLLKLPDIYGCRIILPSMKIVAIGHGPLPRSALHYASTGPFLRGRHLWRYSIYWH